MHAGGDDRSPLAGLSGDDLVVQLKHSGYEMIHDVTYSFVVLYVLTT